MRTRRLIVVTPEGERELLFIGRLTVGRAPECDVSLADTKISRRHVEFEASGSMPRVTDLGSRNGILVNGRKVGAAISCRATSSPSATLASASRSGRRGARTRGRASAPPVEDEERTAILPP